jgi:uncharacterized protein
MEIAPQIFTAKVMHKRLFPKVNAFTYGVYYVATPLPAAPLPSMVQRFPANDLGYRDGRAPELWAREILEQHGITEQVAHIVLITMPRVLGYVFNPVSFYLCMDSDKNLRAVICEVHNTFGEQHSYLCMHQDMRAISAEDWMGAEKLFHVSPFLKREGSYRFRFDIQQQKLGIWIDYYDKENNKQLITSLIGKLSPLTRAGLARAFWSHPLITLKAIALIHWQALKLLAKGIKYVPKPKAFSEKITLSRSFTKM